jgi:hypothetical protein
MRVVIIAGRRRRRSSAEKCGLRESPWRMKMKVIYNANNEQVSVTEELNRKIVWLKRDMERIRTLCHVVDCCPDNSMDVKGITAADLRQMIIEISAIAWGHELNRFF